MPSKFSELMHFGGLAQDVPPGDLCWANFLFEVGEKCAQEKSKTKRLIILPLIDLAAPLIAFGYMYSKFHQENADHLSVDFFKRLPEGSGVIYRSNEGPLNAVFEGMEFHHGLECVKIRYKSHSKLGDTHILLPHQFNRVSVVSRNSENNEKEVGKRLSGIATFAKIIYGPENIGDISSMLDSIWLVGQYSELERELLNIQIHSAVKPGQIGNFNDLLRADHFLKPKEPPFARIVSSYRHDPEFRCQPSTAKFVIFRDASSYLKHQHYYPNASHVLLADFADRNLDHLIQIYNQGYAKRGGELSGDGIIIPRNVIYSGYREAVA